MSRVVVVTDSSTCIPSEYAAECGIRVLPINAYLPEEGRPSDDGPELAGELAAAAEREELLGANRPFVTEYLDAIETPGYDAALVVTPAIEFATMFRNANLATELANRPTVTIDTRTAAAGQALVALAGAEAAARGEDLASVVRVVEDASRRVELVASLATLEPIRRSGPVPEEVLQQSDGGGARSVFRMRDGMVEPLGAVSSAEETLETIRCAFRASTLHGVERSAIFHAGAPELAAHLEDLLGGVDFVSGFSPAMQVYTGPGLVGAAWIPAEAGS